MTNPADHHPHTPASGPRILAGWLIAASLIFPAAAAAVEHRQEISREIPIRGSDTVSLENLAGRVRVEPAAGAAVEIEMTVVAEAKSRTEAEQLAGLVALEEKTRGDRLVLLARYPVEDYDDFHYPGPEGGDSGGWLDWGSHTNGQYQGRKVTVHTKPSRGAVTLWADIVLRIPSGLDGDVRNMAGGIETKGVRGDLDLDTGSGDILAMDGEGELTVDTGSGDVQVLRHGGAVDADTGSGDVDLRGVDGDVDADTGSGDVDLSDVRAERIRVDTGSGEIRLESVEGSLSADTGSGDVDGRGLVLFGPLEADTGSGDVELAGDFARVERIEIDTGSGEVGLTSPAFPGMELFIQTGSGDIDVDLPGAQVIVSKKDEYRARFGNAAARATISTGSGDVTVHQR